MTPLRKWLLILALVTLVVTVSYFWLDRPLALFLHGQRPHILRILTQIPDPLIWVAVIIFFAFGLLALAGRRYRRCELLYSFAASASWQPKRLRTTSNSCLGELGPRLGIKIIRPSSMMEYTDSIGFTKGPPINPFPLDT